MFGALKLSFVQPIVIDRCHALILEKSATNYRLFRDENIHIEAEFIARLSRYIIYLGHIQRNFSNSVSFHIIYLLTRIMEMPVLIPR